MKIKAILFDLDGTLVDSNDQVVAAWVEVFARHGRPVVRDAIHAQIGKGADLLVPALLPGADAETASAFGQLHGEIYRTDFRHSVQPFPKAHDLLVRVRNSGRDVALASSASKDDLHFYLDRLGAHHLISAFTTVDDVDTSSPRPTFSPSRCRGSVATPIKPSPSVTALMTSNPPERPVSRPSRCVQANSAIRPSRTPAPSGFTTTPRISSILSTNGPDELVACNGGRETLWAIPQRRYVTVG